jgi:hypothetical protein
MATTDSPDFTKSTYRERLVEQLFVGEVLRYLWGQGVHDVEVLKPVVAHSGYDVVLEYGRVIRHIELKVSNAGGKRKTVNVNIGLQRAPSGCVVWINVNQVNLELRPFWWYGAEPGLPLPSLEGFRVGKQPRGAKQERSSILKYPAASSLDSKQWLRWFRNFSEMLRWKTYNTGHRADENRKQRGSPLMAQALAGG